MIKNGGFSFKRFHVRHDRCAMKVGTDGILLGAWADVSGARSLLDLGAGTGLVALMLAQRTNDEVRISAVEIDPAAFSQAQENIAASPWAARIALYHQDITEFGRKCGQKSEGFDLITANPPYFPQGVGCSSTERSLARYIHRQTHSDWLDIAAGCLTARGKIHFILPFEAGKKLIKQTALHCIEYCEVITRTGKVPQRLLLTFGMQPEARKESRLIIYDGQNRYHPDFIKLTKDFYLKF